MKSAIASEMQKLNSADQVAFVAAMNEAISAMPGGEADKDAIFAAANDAALQSAAPGNVAKVLAETFATVPAESLPAVTAALGDTINAAAKAAGDNNSATIVAAAKNAVGETEARTANSDNADTRKKAVISLFAGLDGAPENLEELVVASAVATTVAATAESTEKDATEADAESTAETAAADTSATASGTAENATSDAAEAAPVVPVSLPTAASTVSVLSDLTVSPASLSNTGSSSYQSSSFSSDVTVNEGSTTQSSDTTTVTESTGYFGQTTN